MKLLFEILLSILLHPIAMILMWINLLARGDISTLRKIVWFVASIIWGLGPILYILGSRRLAVVASLQTLSCGESFTAVGVREPIRRLPARGPSPAHGSAHAARSHRPPSVRCANPPPRQPPVVAGTTAAIRRAQQ